MTRDGTILLKHGLVDPLTLLDIVHPLPCAFVERGLLIYGGVVIKLVTVLSSQLSILFLDCSKIRLEVLGEGEVLWLIKWLRIQSRVKEEGGTGTVKGTCAEHL